MHCPRCGYRQASGEIRFCTKCGLAMGDVKEILVPQLREVKKKNNIGKGVRQGLGMMLLGLAVITILAILRDFTFVPQVFIKIAALVFCVGGAIRMGYSYVFNENTAQKINNASLEFDAETNTLPDKSSNGKLLPQAHFHPPVNVGAKLFETAEMAQSTAALPNTQPKNFSKTGWSKIKICKLKKQRGAK